jgi:hypothetical protein
MGRLVSTFDGLELWRRQPGVEADRTCLKGYTMSFAVECLPSHETMIQNWSSAAQTKPTRQRCLACVDPRSNAIIHDRPYAHQLHASLYKPI